MNKAGAKIDPYAVRHDKALTQRRRKAGIDRGQVHDMCIGESELQMPAGRDGGHERGVGLIRGERGDVDDAEAMRYGARRSMILIAQAGRIRGRGILFRPDIVGRT
jgi:hypothetical protein